MPTISLFFFLLSFSLLNQQKPNNELKFEVKPLKSLAMLQCTCSHFLKCLIHIIIYLCLTVWLFVIHYICLLQLIFVTETKLFMTRLYSTCTLHFLFDNLFSCSLLWRHIEKWQQQEPNLWRQTACKPWRKQQVCMDHCCPEGHNWVGIQRQISSDKPYPGL